MPPSPYREVVKIYKELNGLKPNWHKYQATWKSLTLLAQTCARSMQALPPANSPFRFERATCTYANWIKSIGGADNALPPGSFIPTATKTSHPESTLVRFLHLPPIVNTEWAKLVAASVDIMAKNLFQPPPVTLNNANNQLKQGVQALQYLDKLKSCSSSFDNTTADEVNSNNTEDPSLPRSCSLDALHKFWNVIMAYVILHTHANSKPPMSQAKKKSNQQALQTRDSLSV
ncbi:hypothetical protein PtB15_10B229 [Puccinia triticina]|nr:hypothetical protein PtB15_10B229 [Puccinia triticina]